MGYALEVLNRKDRATHQRVRKNAIGSIRALANKMLDAHAYAEAADGAWWAVDPEEVYPTRDQMKIVVGSGDIVDATSDREDFGIGLVSRRHVLRRRGIPDKEITRIEGEVATELRVKVGIDTEATMAVAERESQTQLELARINATARATPAAGTGSE